MNFTEDRRMMTFSDLVKAAKPPKGYSPIPGGKKGGYRKKTGGKWTYWYAGKGQLSLFGMKLPDPVGGYDEAEVRWREAQDDPNAKKEASPQSAAQIKSAIRRLAERGDRTWGGSLLESIYVEGDRAGFRSWDFSKELEEIRDDERDREDQLTAALEAALPGWSWSRGDKNYFDGRYTGATKKSLPGFANDRRMMTFVDLVKATPRPYTGPGKRTGTPGNYSYEYAGDKSGGGATADEQARPSHLALRDYRASGGGKGAEKPEAKAKERAKVEVSKEDLSQGVRERIEKYNLSVVAKAGSPPERAIEIAKQIEAGIKKTANLCKDDPPLCEGNMGIPRSDMPQIMDDKVSDLLKATNRDGTPDEDERAKGRAAVAAGADPKATKAPFEIMLDHFRAEGVEVTKPETIQVGKLKATQEDIYTWKAHLFAETQMKGQWPGGAAADLSKKPIVMSNDGHILDGHHRWAALLIIGEEATMEAITVDLPMAELLDRSFDVPGAGVFRMDGQNVVQTGGKPDYAEYKRLADEKYAGALADRLDKTLPSLLELVKAYRSLDDDETPKRIPGYELEKSEDDEEDPELEKGHEEGHKGQTCAAAHPGKDHKKWSASKLEKGDDEEDDEDPAEKEAREELGKSFFNSIWHSYDGGPRLGR